ncbi:unnamed protein product [Clonostachys rosea f. rosea IK726]|uniref:Uncharacterized protein n=1 Tax=Clonostachys rosea f. rosea IK726 TaxID=1349383 RepID=A0ACA9U9X2_BIOOC|nr:unnamed protein product [Clonostachys rosea f. rosea IK726]
MPFPPPSPTANCWDSGGITVGDKAPFTISDNRWKFSSVDYPDANTREGAERSIAGFDGGEKQVLRVDGLTIRRTQAAVTIYKVDDELAKGGYIASLASAVTLLMAVFF